MRTLEDLLPHEFNAIQPGQPNRFALALEFSGYSVSEAARMLGVHRSTVYDYTRAKGIETAGHRQVGAETARVVRECGGDLARAAAELDVSQGTLARRLERMPKLRAYVRQAKRDREALEGPELCVGEAPATEQRELGGQRLPIEHANPWKPCRPPAKRPVPRSYPAA